MLYSIAIVTVSGLVRGFAGFGGTMIIAPGLAMVFPTPHAVGISILLNVIVTLQLLPAAVPHVKWRDISLMSIAALVTPPLGTLILVAVDGDTMRRAIAVIVMGFTVILASGWRYTGKPHPLAAVVAGATGGVITGAAGTGGPPVILYIFAGAGSAAEKRASIIVVFGMLLIATLLSLIWHDIVNADTLWRVAVLAPFFLGMAWVGARLFKKSSDKLYHRIALVALFAIAGAALLS